MFLCYLIVDKAQQVFVGAYERHSFWMRIVQTNCKDTAFSPLVLKSNIYEKIKYTRKRQKCFGTVNIRNRMLIRSVDFEISNQNDCTFKFQ